MKKFFKAFFLTIFTIMLTGAVFATGYVAKTIMSADKIDPSTIYDSISINSCIYDSNGELIQTINYGEDREIVSIDDIPDDMKHAIIAIEDKTFYTHHGFNIKRIIGAIIDSLKNDTGISGTSTITQQLARNVYLADIKSKRSLNRKIVEMYYAYRIEQTLSKDQILEAYLNTVYFGYGAYGISSAAETYFSEDVKDLTLQECAALAALPQAPDSYALIKTEGEEEILPGLYLNDASKDRRFLVLDLMAEQGYISTGEAEKTKNDLATFINPCVEEKNSVNTYFCDYVIEQVVADLEKEYNIEESEAQDMVYKGGLKIYTTLDSEIQNIIYNEFLNDNNFPWASEEPQAAMVVTEVGTGKVLAMMGGRNASGEHLFNRAVNPRQPGSSIKPLSVYSAALQKSADCAKGNQNYPFVAHNHDKQGASGWGNYITASSKVTDEKMTFNGEIWPYNANRKFTGYQTFRTALQQSINTCAVKIQLQVGNDYSINMLKSYGITTLQLEGSINDENSAALALGAMTNGVTPLEMALAYATFPNGGVRNSAVCYTKVLDYEGKEILKGKSDETQVLDEGVAFIMTDVLKSVVSKGIAKNARISGVEVGGKTGTTNDQYDIWFDGFTPKYSAALWIGTDNNVKMSSMSETAARLWSKIMSQIPDITSGDYPDMPSSVVVQGKEFYTSGTQPYANNYNAMRNSSSASDDDDNNEVGGTFTPLE